jgi:Mg2+-importing ATPase
MTKDLGVIAHGIELGRRTFVNTLKYIKVTISANFGNMLSMAISSFFLTFLPMLPAQILLLNFLSDFPDLAIATDNVDKEDVRHPRVWDVVEIRTFMIIFGVVSTCFDLPVFAILIWGFNVDPATFRTTWFVESTMTELVAMLVLRTTLPFWRSRPSNLLLGSTIGLGVIVVAFPYIALGASLELVPLSAALMATVMGIIITYIIANEVTKKIYYKRHNAEHARENAALS